MTKNDQINITIVIGERYPLLSLSLVTEPLRVANREASRPVFNWSILSADGAVPRSSSGLKIEIDGEIDNRDSDAIILLAAYSPTRMISEQLKHWLRLQAAKGTLMGCVDTGALLFAEAGLLSKCQVTAHQEAIIGFREKYNNVLFVDKLCTFEQNLYSSAGGVATFDMMLLIIERFTCASVAHKVAKVLNYKPVQESMSYFKTKPKYALPRSSTKLTQAIEIMLTNIENPLAINEVCQRVDLSITKLRRLFLKHLSMSTRDYYLELRLDRARNLLRNSTGQVSAIALMCGFPATESLCRAYKKKYGVSPGQDRNL